MELKTVKPLKIKEQFLLNACRSDLQPFQSLMSYQLDDP